MERAGDHMGSFRAGHLLLLMHWTAGRHHAAEQAGLATIEHARAVGDRTREIRMMSSLATSSTYGPTPVDEAAALLHPAARDDRRRSEDRCPGPRVALTLGGDAR